jgi:hypothetical protein
MRLNRTAEASTESVCMSTGENKHRRFGLALKVVAGAIAFYIFTVGLAVAISGHMEIGHLPWLRSEMTLDALDAYVRPSGYLARVPAAGWVFGLSESFWRRVTGAPICVSYGTRLEQILISDTPKGMMETLRREWPDADVVNVAKPLGGRNHQEFICWIIRFKQDGKL